MVIVGCGRSATGYIAKVLRTSNLDVGHERLGSVGVASWYATVSNRINSHQDIVLPEYQFHEFLHQVRSPLKVMSSCQRWENDDYNTWEFISRYIPEMKMNDSLTRKCMLYWHHWNFKAEALSSWTYRIEDLFNYPTWEIFCEYTELNPEIDYSKISKRYNWKKDNLYPVLTLQNLLAEDELLTSKIFDQAKRYGYEDPFAFAV